MSSVSESLDKLKYVSLNTLFAKDAILSGDSYMIPFIYAIVANCLIWNWNSCFKEKDLPL